MTSRKVAANPDASPCLQEATGHRYTRSAIAGAAAAAVQHKRAMSERALQSQRFTTRRLTLPDA